MKIGNFEVSAGINEVIITAVIGFAALCFFVSIPPANDKLLNLCIGALIGWGASVITKKGDSQ